MSLLHQLNPLHWVAPRLCLSCKRRSPQPLCVRCHDALSQQQRPQALALQKPLRVWAWGYYQGEVERAMHQLKYQGGMLWGKVFGEICGRWWQSLPQRKQEQIVWQVVAIPLAQDRYQERGYNQAEEIAYTFARWNQYPHRPQWLHRVRSTQAQHSLTPAERAANIAAAFQADPAVKGKAILPIDDICTTGSTLQEAAQALYSAGAVRVEAVVVARPAFHTSRQAA